jgi:putative flippase GtrA
VAILKIGQDSSEPSGIRGKVIALDKRFAVFKLAKFAIASGCGFLLSEGILTLGVFLLYGKLTAPSDAYSSPTFLVLDVSGLALGVALSFFLNERYTVQAHRHKHRASSRLPVRLLKFEGVNAMGNLTIIVVQFALLMTLSITPVIGNVVGAIVSYPVTYLISMRFVWKHTTGDSTGSDRPRRGSQQPKKVGHPPLPVIAIAVVVGLYFISHLVRRRERRPTGGQASPYPLALDAGGPRDDDNSPPRQLPSRPLAESLS